MWARTFQDRLGSWYQLRDKSQTQSLTQCLEEINAWWFRWPWCAYRLHWDDQDSWPDPWQLLSDNYYCDLARGLGILYTISLLDRADLTSAELVLTEDDSNLVLVAKEKYILNWDRDTIVNTNQEVKIKRQLTQQEVKQQYL